MAGLIKSLNITDAILSGFTVYMYSHVHVQSCACTCICICILLEYCPAIYTVHLHAVCVYMYVYVCVYVCVCVCVCVCVGWRREARLLWVLPYSSLSPWPPEPQGQRSADCTRMQYKHYTTKMYILTRGTLYMYMCCVTLPCLFV